MTVKVKPLVWGKHPDADEYYSPVFSRDGAEMGCYIVSCDSTGADWLVYINRNMMDEYHPTIEAAKAAAQADYEDRILAAIEAPVQEPDETAALRAKLAEVERERDQWRIDCEEFRLERDAAQTDRDEERKLADDLARALLRANCILRENSILTHDVALARHAARRKEQQG